MQGKRFTDEQVHRVKYLLAKTEMTIHEIAVRTGSSESTVATINRRFDVRRYNGKRAQWEMGSASVVESSVRASSDAPRPDFSGELQYR
jgi:IS30 family transposase